jgi:hypothetical protein
MKNITGIFILALALSPTIAGAQKLYRCGTTYSEVPCAPDAKTLNVTPAASTPAGEQRGSDLCFTKVKARLNDPESARFTGAAPGKTEVIDFAGSRVVARRYEIRVNWKTSGGGFTGDTPFTCFVSEDDRRVLRIDGMR